MSLDKIREINNLVAELNRYRDAYYNNSKPLVSDYEYDSLLDRLQELEDETGYIKTTSPTQSVGYEVKSELKKVTHSHPMLSLDKTKSVDELLKFIDNRPCILMHKMDGLTVSLRYVNGELISAETRGNGVVGEDIFHNAKVFKNIPLKIAYKDELVVDGEAIITYEDFERINSKLIGDDKYKNPRNLASGSVRQFDSKIASERNIRFIAWKCVKGFDDTNDFLKKLLNLYGLGFETVWKTEISKDTTKEELEEEIEFLKQKAKDVHYPIDGLVMSYRDIAYGESLGTTDKYIRSQLAFKFYDEEEVTRLKDVEWSMGKTGNLTPVAIFEDVKLEGTTVNRASVHNVSIFKELKLGLNDKISVYKSNQIIPQIRENLSKSATFAIPKVCPVCGHLTRIVKDNDSEVLKCDNPDCKGKLLGKLSHFCSRDAMNIIGLSESTLEFLIGKGWINGFKDLYHLDQQAKDWMRYDGFGKTSVTKTLTAIENSREVSLESFLNALSIPLVGKSTAKLLAKESQYDFNKFVNVIEFRGANAFMDIDGFGKEMNKSLRNWWSEHKSEIISLAEEMRFKKPVVKENIGKDLSGLTFCITGSLNHFSNRDEAKNEIEAHNGKVSGSVSKSTSYLVNNDITSSSSKNTKAKSYGVPIITEDELIKMLRG